MIIAATIKERRNDGRSTCTIYDNPVFVSGWM
jgi:hypothetical protein